MSTDGQQGEKNEFRYRAIAAPPRKKSLPIGTMFLIGLVAVGCYGGYYGYCRYKVNVKVNAFVEEAHTLRQRLFRVGRAIDAEDVKTAAVGFATNAGVEIDEASIKVTLEPLTAENTRKLPKVAAAAMGIAMGLPKHQAPNLVGFSATITAKHGVARTVITHERHTYFEDVKQ